MIVLVTVYSLNIMIPITYFQCLLFILFVLGSPLALCISHRGVVRSMCAGAGMLFTGSSDTSVVKWSLVDVLETAGAAEEAAVEKGALLWANLSLLICIICFFLLRSHCTHFYFEFNVILIA